MKIRYYSEKLNKEFDSEDELMAAEELFDKDLQEKEEAARAKEKAVRSRKSELAKFVDEADKKFNEAENAYVKEKAEANARYVEFVKKQRDELEKFSKDNSAHLNECIESLKKAESERYTAIKNYNKEFGIYKKYITEEEAEKCLERSRSIFDDLFSFSFPFLF